jgi:hypothetical protein
MEQDESERPSAVLQLGEVVLKVVTQRQGRRHHQGVGDTSTLLVGSIYQAILIICVGRRGKLQSSDGAAQKIGEKGKAWVGRRDCVRQQVVHAQDSVGIRVDLHDAELRKQGEAIRSWV